MLRKADQTDRSGATRVIHPSPAAERRRLRDPESLAALHSARRVTLSAADRARLAKIESGATPTYEALTELVSLVNAKKLSPEEAILRVDAKSMAKLQLPQFATEPTDPPAASGLGVSNGCASGIAVFDAKRAAELVAQGESVILVVREITPDEVAEMAKVQGVICTMGDYSSHTSVLARDYGIPALNGNHFDVDGGARSADLGGVRINEGDRISIRVEGADKAEVFDKEQKIVTHADQASFKTLLSWCQAFKGIDVRANADLPGAVTRAIETGASGVGLVRTEHMFFGDRRKTLQAAILTQMPEELDARLKELEQFQTEDFIGIFENAQGKSVSIRLMDPPLHEFLPARSEARARLNVETLAHRLNLDPKEVEAKLRENPIFDRWVKVDFDRLFFTAEQESDEMMALAEAMDFPPELIHDLAKPLHEVNPMMGLRGVRLSVAKPEIYEMQVRAMFEAAAKVTAEGTPVDLKIMIPLVNTPEEVDHVRGIIERAKKQVSDRVGRDLDYHLLVMVETPAAALRAHELADRCDGFSFGTNDLTQFTLAMSRGDAAPVLDAYKGAGISTVDPFQKIDPESVGKLISVAIGFARHSGTTERPDFPAGICGEQGADPATIAAAREWGVDYVSVSPYRVATALVASAQQNIEASKDTGKDRGLKLVDLLAARSNS